jgi:protein SCO1/2
MFRLLASLFVLLAAWPALAQDEKNEAGKEEKLFRPFGEPVGDFKLQERNGEYVRARDLLGKIWVAHFFFPECTGTCTRTTPNMKRLQDMVRGRSDVRLVSIALNSDELDTLNVYAKVQHAEPDQWLFLTGPDEKVHEIVSLQFRNPAMRNDKPTPGNQVIHSSYLVLIDPDGIMVGFVDGTQDKAADALKEQIDLLRTKRRVEQRIPITGADLPRFNALLNSSCTVLLLLGWILIRLGYQTPHKVVMLLALAVSMVFLASYLFYHFVVMEMEPTRFRGEGAARYVYFAILLSHTILAIVVAPLALYITVQGLRNALPAHVKVARWTLPIWLYVSVTGVVVYWMLYRMEW